ncbi:Cardioacceleratory peptide receptor [Nymphon striatum]|nr:Cardioacceleratory peptide receptor [Nymphon striatum]
MGVIQVSTNENGLIREEKPIKRLGLQRVVSVTANKGIPIEQYIKGNYNVLSKKVFCAIRELKFDSCITLEKNIDLLWEMSFTFSDVTRPNWSGFMQAYRKGTYPGKSEVSYDVTVTSLKKVLVAPTFVAADDTVYHVFLRVNVPIYKMYQAFQPKASSKNLGAQKGTEIPLFRGRILVALAWGLSVVFSSPTLYLYDVKDIMGKSQCWIDLGGTMEWRIYIMVIAFALFFIPTLIITACYAIILNCIFTDDAVFDKYSKRASSRGIIPRAKIKTIKLTFVIVFVFIICWSPYFLYDIFQVFGYITDSNTTFAVSTFIQSLAPLNSAANPLIYCLFSTHICRNMRRYRIIEWFLQKLNCCKCLDNPPQQGMMHKNESTSMTAMTNYTTNYAVNHRPISTTNAF